MARTKIFLIGMILGTTVTLLAMQFHVINTAEGLTVLPRANRPPLRSVYVDVRNWTDDTWQAYPEVREAVVLSGRSELIGEQLGPVDDAHPWDQFTQSNSTRSSSAQSSLMQSRQPELALKSLVPIQFQSTGEESISRKVPEPTDAHWGKSTSPSSATPPPAPGISLGSPAPLPGSRPQPSGLPRLQHPIPIEAGTGSAGQTSANNNAPSESTGESKNLFTDVLKALVPGNKSGGASPSQPGTNPQRTPDPRTQYGAAYPAQMQAPGPGQNSQPSNGNWSIPPNGTSAPLPVVRPF